jgi:hypothetical protein
MECAPDVTEQARAKLDRGRPVTRKEAAAFLSVDPKTLYRRERGGSLKRCPTLGREVTYPARAILELASANGKER